MKTKMINLILVATVTLAVVSCVGYSTKKETLTNFTEAVDSLDFDMIAIEGGTFTMGCTCTSEQLIKRDYECCWSDNRPAHSVILSSYCIGKYEVTQALWNAVMGGSNRKPDRYRRSVSDYEDLNMPVGYVCWDDAQEFICKLNAKSGNVWERCSDWYGSYTYFDLEDISDDLVMTIRLNVKVYYNAHCAKPPDLRHHPPLCFG